MFSRTVAIEVIKAARSKSIFNGHTRSEVAAAETKATYLQAKYEIFVEVVYIQCEQTKTSRPLVLYF